MTSRNTKLEPRLAVGGVAGWLLARLRGKKKTERRLVLVERISLAPRQTLALVEAEGRRFLVATSVDGSPAFCALDRPNGSGTARWGARVSW